MAQTDTVEAGGLAVAFGPVFELGPEGARLYGVEGLAHWPGAPPAQAPGLTVSAGDELFADRPRCAAVLEAAAGLPAGLRLFLPVHAATLAGDRGFARALVRCAARADLPVERLVVSVVGDPCGHSRGPLAGLEELRWRGLGVAARVARPGDVEPVLHGRRPGFLRLAGSLLRDLAPACELLIRVVAHAAERGACLLVDGVDSRADLRRAQALGVRLVAGSCCWRLAEGPSDLRASSWSGAASAVVA